MNKDKKRPKTTTTTKKKNKKQKTTPKQTDKYKEQTDSCQFHLATEIGKGN